MSPLSRIGGWTPSLNCSVIAISTCVYLRVGRARDALDAAFRPRDRQLLLARELAGLREVGVLDELMPFPNSASTCSCVRWM
jgi:hypothetical protein